jgi:mRNA interferase RelE/StbE
MTERWKLVFHIKIKKLARDFSRGELERIEEALDNLAKMELNRLDIKKLEGWKDIEKRDVYRIRVGRDIRILISFDRDSKEIHVWRIARRESVYDE